MRKFRKAKADGPVVAMRLANYDSPLLWIGLAMKQETLTVEFLVSSVFMMFVAGCVGGRSARSSEEYIDEKLLNARVTRALNESPEYKLNRVVVQSFGGVVQLSGFVNTPDQRSKATEIAQGVSGVKSVENNITIQSN